MWLQWQHVPDEGSIALDVTLSRSPYINHAEQFSGRQKYIKVLNLISVLILITHKSR